MAATATATLLGVAVLRSDPGPLAAPDAAPLLAPACFATTAEGRLRLDPGQAADAATIAAVAKRDGLPDHAVTVALTVALQESKLRNLPYGDLDSVGIFQQRPSQGWGTPEQLVVPSFAAAAFYGALVNVHGWEAVPVGDAAQAVQRSAAPDAYAQWEHQAAILTAALTGQRAAAFSCRFPSPAPTPAADPDPLSATMAAELGPLSLNAPLTEARGWTVAGWLIAHGATFNVSSVTFMGQQWTAATGAWAPTLPALAILQVGRG